MKTQYLAVGRGNVTAPAADDPRTAALSFFERYPARKICSVVEGYYINGRWHSQVFEHRFWRDISRQQIDQLFPEVQAA